MPAVFSVVLTWNNLGETIACLESLQRTAYDAGRHHVILVDNASSDGTVDRVRAQFPAVRVIANRRNLGYAAGCNVGIGAALDAGADYVWLLNNDARAAPDALREMVRIAESDPTIGIVGPRVRTRAGVDELGAWVDLAGARVRVAGADDPPLGADRFAVDYVWGCAMLVAARVFDRVGGFDERFVAYFEDTDLCWRAQRAGFQVVAAPAALVWHGGARSADRRPLWQLWRRAMGRLRFFWKHTRGRARAGAAARTIGREWPLLAAGTVLRHWRGQRARAAHPDREGMREG
ncbi:MAG: glycosyltransferase family 2 protein [Anaerolineae bacterium]|nr:glycosyltransferase family 2 protein [Anaerolineae bacterium]